MTPEARALDHRPVMDHGVRDGSEFLVGTNYLLNKSYSFTFAGLNIQIQGMLRLNY